MRLATSLLVLLELVSCVSIPTPSGRPEVKVSLELPAAKSRLATALTLNGWVITGSDDLGVSATMPIHSSQTLLLGTGNWVSRFMLTPVDGGTQIRAACHLYTTSHSQDVSAAQQGYGTQEFLEAVFQATLIGGPYLPQRK